MTINTIKWSPIEQEIEIFFFQISSVIITTSLVNSYRQKWRGSVQERTKFKNVGERGRGRARRERKCWDGSEQGRAEKYLERERERGRGERGKEDDAGLGV